MPSIVWGRDAQEAYDNPYEYDAQEQFLREARKFLEDLNLRLDIYTLQYHRDDTSLEKATWMLSLDLIDALAACAELLAERRHRPAARLFRDCVETIDLLKVLHSGTPRALKTLTRWYQNDTPSHRESREYLLEVEGQAAADQRKTFFQQLSKFTHRTYLALHDSFSLGRDDLLVHDSHSMGLLVSPQAISSYLAVLANLILQATQCLADSKILPQDRINAALITSLEEHTVPRRFTPRERRSN